MSNQSHWTDEVRNKKPEGCHLCHTEGVPLTNYSSHYGGYQGPHWLCGLCSYTQAGSMMAAGNDHIHADWVGIVGDVAALLHAAGLTPEATEGAAEGHRDPEHPTTEATP